ncbi:MAG: RidA family protein [Pseudomonadota bacterium]
MRRVEPFANKPETHASGILSEQNLFIAGQVGQHPESGETPDALSGQVEQSLKNVVAVVKEAGGEPEDITKLTVYVTDMGKVHSEFSKISALFAAAFKDSYLPAISLIGVSALMSPDWSVEIEGHAILQSARA